MHVLWIITGLLFAGTIVGDSGDVQEIVRVDMNADWIRRDWHKCQDPTKFRIADGVVTIESNKSGALFWQVPMQNGQAVEIDQNQKWVRECRRLPISFGEDILTQNQSKEMLIDISEYPYITWRWWVDGTIDDTNTADAKGKIRKTGDDFAVKLGISVLRKGGKDLREIAYVWTRKIPEESLLYQKTTIVPFFLEWKWYRIVVESGEENVGNWVVESRNLYEDYKTAYPKEDPGQIIRVYVMTDSNNTKGRLTGAFADITFHRHLPQRQ